MSLGYVPRSLLMLNSTLMAGSNILVRLDPVSPDSILRKNCLRPSY